MCIIYSVLLFIARITLPAVVHLLKYLHVNVFVMLLCFPEQKAESARVKKTKKNCTFLLKYFYSAKTSVLSNERNPVILEKLRISQECLNISWN
jgi:hypothetical protein